MRATAPRILFALSLLAASVAWRESEQLTLQPTSRLWVEGTSTVRSFSCRATVLNAIVDVRGTGAVPAVLSGDKAVTAVDVKVPAEKLDCGNGTMNDHMREALKVHENPTILFRMSGYDLQRGNDAVTGTLRGTLSLGGAQRPVAIAARGEREGEQLHVTGSTEVAMSEYGLKPPSLMFGRIKVGDKVTVKFDLFLKS